MSSVPKKYQPDPRKWEQETWLREKYWEDELSTREIADLTSVSRKTIRESMIELGIPRRSVGSAGFTTYDPDHESKGYDESYEKFPWK